jgi:ribonucleoside-diphosphate reductase alpha chain
MGYDPKKAIKHLNSAKGDKPIGFGPNRIDSIPHALAIALRKHLEKTGKMGDKEQQRLTDIGSKQEHCPKCYSPNVQYVSGCSEPTCQDCGYSKCS